MSRRAWIVPLLLAWPGAAFAQETPDALAQKAYAVLKESCNACHGGTGQQSGKVVVLNHGNLVATRPGSETPFVTPGKPDDSLLWQYVESGYMPQSGSAQADAFKPERKEILKKWIDAGAPAWKVRQVKPVDDRAILDAIRTHLLTVRSDDAKHLRYFSFASLQNSEQLGEEELRLHRAALSKAINSLTWERTVVLPRAVPGTQESVFFVDLRKLGWDQKGVWRKAAAAHPYGLAFDEARDDTLAELAKNVKRLAGHDEQLVLRADWFIVNATRPPLYHDILGLPKNLSDLERDPRIQLDFEKHFRDTTADRQLLARAGFAQSGVSRQNRLVERHDLPNGGFWWISYDFKPRKAKGDLVRFPLGPKFAANSFDKFAFDHDGGELIFSLPNGLQAYLLVDAKGNRLDDFAPADVVFDKSAISGLPGIINGLSCMNCHKDGMIRFEDEIRTSDALGGEALQKIRDLYPTRETMRKLVDQDRTKFLASLETVVGPFLKVGDDAKRSIETFPEPIGRVAERYNTDLGPTEVALELSLSGASELQIVIRNNRDLLRFGLGPLAAPSPGTLKRDKWETVEGFSLFQRVRQSLGRGEVPVN
jgi:serine/threonine-protein kinase